MDARTQARIVRAVNRAQRVKAQRLDREGTLELVEKGLDTRFFTDGGCSTVQEAMREALSRAKR